MILFRLALNKGATLTPIGGPFELTFTCVWGASAINLGYFGHVER